MGASGLTIGHVLASISMPMRRTKPPRCAEVDDADPGPWQFQHSPRMDGLSPVDWVAVLSQRGRGCVRNERGAE